MTAAVKSLKPPKALEVQRQFHRRQAPPTLSGRATLVELSDDDAAALSSGDVLLSSWASGYLALIVDRVRDDMWGELGALQPCKVIEAHTLEGRRFSLAPCDTLRARIRGEIGS